MRRYVPLLGPNKGKLVYLHDDGTVEVAPDVDSASVAPSVALPEVRADAPVLDLGINAGEIDGGIDTRSNRDKMIRTMRESGFRDPEGRAREAVRRWDAGVRSGSIKLR